MRWVILALILATAPLLAQEPGPIAIPDEVTIDLENPTFKEGVLSTTEGGVIQGDNIRIQAREITYTRQKVDDQVVSKVTARGDLMVQRGCDAFVGECLEYDFVERRGVLYRGRSAIGPWYVGGEVVRLCPDETYEITNGFITTCEDVDSEWQLRAKKVKISKDGWISAQFINVRFFNLPVFYLPTFRTHLRTLLDAPITYRAEFNGPLGPRVGMRYRFFEWRDFRAYLRAEYFLKTGPGGGIETEYCPQGKSTRFRTQSYVARNWRPTDTRNKFRYRFAGTYEDYPFGNCDTRVRMRYDVLSDNLMPSDYRTEDFQLHTARQTQIDVTHFDDQFIANLVGRVQVNDFQAVNQELPVVRVGFRPRNIGATGIVAVERASVGYLDYRFARPSDTQGFHASRLATNHTFYRPFRFGCASLLPQLDASTIYYSRSEDHNAELLLSASGSVEGKLRFSKLYGCYKHLAEPYARYLYALEPTSSNGDHFIFSDRDAYARLNWIRLGMRNLIFRRGSDCCPPTQPLSLDLFAYGFIDTPDIRGAVPRLYGHMTWKPTPVFRTDIEAAWNVTHNQPDHIYSRAKWTLSEDIALSAEFRYRSKWDYFKADPFNWVLDSSVPEATLLKDRVSDRRFTLLSHLFVRVTPTLAVDLEARNGWRARLDPRYFEWKASVEWLLQCRWRFFVFYERRQGEKDDYGISLRLGPGRCPCPVGQTPGIW